MIDISFSSDIKKQLCGADYECGDCASAELAGTVEFSGTLKDGVLRFSTENADVGARIRKNISEALSIRLDTDGNGKAFQFSSDGDGIAPIILKRIHIFRDTDANPGSDTHLSKCCLKSYVRGCFLGGGSINDPKKSYHMEFDTKNPAGIDHLKLALSILGYSAKITYRKGHYLVYVKESDKIAEILGIMGAGRGAMDLYTVQVEKEMRNSMNRRVNCETANMDKAFTAAAIQVAAIKRIADSGGLDALPPVLYEMAVVRLENPSDSLKELADKIGIGKSGVNHRLKRLIEIAEEEYKL